MKIIHCADIHIDSKLDFNGFVDKSRIRAEEIFKNFELTVNYLTVNQGVKIFIIAGDLFDTEKTTFSRMQKRFIYTVTSHPEIEFFYLKGNHDSSFNAESENMPENLHLFSKEKWTYYKIKNLCVCGREVAGNIPDSFYEELQLDETKKNIVVLHGQITPNTNKADAPLINLKKLSGKNIDYLALGHIHSFEEGRLDERGIWCYSGCLEGRGFDECGKKGFVLLEVDEKNHLKKEFISKAKREIHEVKVDLTDCADFAEISNRVKEQIKNICSEDLVKIILQGEVDEKTDVDVQLLQKTLENEFFFLRIENKVQTKIDFTRYRNDISLKGEFVRLVEKSDLSAEEKTEIILTGLKALSGKVLD